MRRTLVYPIALCLAGLSTLTGCSWFGGGDESGLQAALGRVAATADTRARITYGDTAGIVKIAGKDWTKTKGFAPLLASGVEQFAPYGEQMVTDTGIAVLDADYVISAGAGAVAVGVVAGGQRGDRVSGAMTKLGWHQDDGRLLGPDLGAVGGTTAGQYALALGQVKVAGGDVLYGQREAKLSIVGKPSGRTLAEDERIKAIAECLGDVVSAEIDADEAGGASRPTAIGIGVKRPDGDGSTPRAIVCTSWSNATAANKYASRVAATLNTEKATTGEAFSKLLTKTKINKADGDQNIASWEADTPSDVLLIKQMLTRGDLPGLSK